MPRTDERSSWRVLDPVARVSEILFGLIMALTFTGALSAFESSRDDVRLILIGAIGCNIAWGLVDAVMYLMTQLTEHGRRLRAIRLVRGADDPAAANAVIEEALPPLIAQHLPEGSLDAVRQRLKALDGLPRRAGLSRQDFLGAFGVFLLVVVATFPVVLPFLFIHEVGPALRTSNGIAIAMMFACGYKLGRYAEIRPWAMGLSMALIGCALVAITIALGG